MAGLGRRLTIASAILVVLCVTPIQLYAAFGPADGNPIGLGLLMVFGGLLFGALTLVGVTLWIGGAIQDRRARATGLGKGEEHRT